MLEDRVPARDTRGDTRLREAWRALEGDELEAVSTDVFDTLLWRLVAEPVDVFPLVGRRLRAEGRLAPHLAPRAFGRLRVEAERAARRRREQAGGGVEVGLTEIYGLLPLWVFDTVDPAERARAEAVEVEVEREHLVPDLDVLELLLGAQERGRRLLAVSDTYFSARHLRALFAGPLLDDLVFEAVLTSSDHGRGKREGLLELAYASLGVPPGRVLHLGDHPQADVAAAERAGARPVLFVRREERVAALMEREQRRGSGSRALEPADAERAALVTGVAALRTKVLSRRERELLPGALRPFWEFGAEVLGPVLAGFAEWILDRGRERRASRVHCLMREGGFLADLVNAGAAYREVELEARPLWLNRLVCERAAIVAGSERELEPFLAGRRPPSVELVCRRLGLELGQVPRLAGHAETTVDDPATRRALLAELTGDEAVRATLVAQAREQRRRIAAYVERELPGEGPRQLVLADLGWAASAQRLIARILHDAGLEVAVIGLYLLTHEGATETVLSGSEVVSFLAQLGVPEEAARIVIRSPEVVEQACMPSFGTQVGLTATLEPELAHGERITLQSVEAESVRAGVRAFQRQLGRYATVLPGAIPSLGAAPELLRGILVRSVAAPTPDELASFAGWLHDENRGSARAEAVGSGFAEARYLDPLQLRDLPFADLYWPFAVAAAVDPAWGEQIRAAAAGDLPWEALASAPLESGAFTAWIGRGKGLEEQQGLGEVPRRNRLGLSRVRGRLRATLVGEVALRPSERPCIVRLDFLELRCAVRGREEPTVLRFERLHEQHGLDVRDAFVVRPNVLVSHGADSLLVVHVDGLVTGEVFRVDVDCAFAALPTGPVLPAGRRFGSLEEAEARFAGMERVLASMQGSPSWRVTAPLRRAKGLVRRGAG